MRIFQPSWKPRAQTTEWQTMRSAWLKNGLRRAKYTDGIDSAGDFSDLSQFFSTYSRERTRTRGFLSSLPLFPGQKCVTIECARERDFLSKRALLFHGFSRRKARRKISNSDLIEIAAQFIVGRDIARGDFRRCTNWVALSPRVRFLLRMNSRKLNGNINRFNCVTRRGFGTNGRSSREP